MKVWNCSSFLIDLTQNIINTSIFYCHFAFYHWSLLNSIKKIEHIYFYNKRHRHLLKRLFISTNRLLYLIMLTRMLGTGVKMATKTIFRTPISTFSSFSPMKLIHMYLIVHQGKRRPSWCEHQWCLQTCTSKTCYNSCRSANKSCNLKTKPTPLPSFAFYRKVNQSHLSTNW